jgi:hypothetical protein
MQPPKGPSSHLTSRLAVVIAAVAMLLLLGAGLLRHPRKPIATNTFRLGLNVEREGQVLLVAWDRSSQPVHNATHAILHIKDGPQQSQLDLNRQQLGAANVKYWPETPKVTFMLEVYQGDGSISESVQVASDPASVTAQAKRLPNGTQREVPVDAARPSPFAVPVRREFTPDPSITSALNPQARLLITAAATPPPSVAENSDRESRLGRMIGKVPFLRRLRKHPQHSENEYPQR